MVTFALNELVAGGCVLVGAVFDVRHPDLLGWTDVMVETARVKKPLRSKSFGFVPSSAEEALREVRVAVLTELEKRREMIDRDRRGLLRRPSVLRIATDASKSMGSTCGVAWVAEDGRYEASVASRETIAAAEVHAIRMAVDFCEEMTAGGQSIEILTDSRVALTAITRKRFVSKGWQPSACDDIKAIRHVAKVLPIKFRWVRGHSGHVLNDAADQLAIHARQCHQWNRQPGETRKQRQLIVRTALDQDSMENRAA